MTRVAGIVLCGGRSSRMGRPKHLLPFGDETVLQRVVHTVLDALGEVVVVGSPGQELPELSDDVQVAFDDDEHLGPLSGLRTGLRSVAGEVDAVYLTGCDTPLLSEQFVRRIVTSLTEEYDVAAVVEDGFFHPLAAVYRTSLLPQIESLMDSGELRPRRLIHSVRHLKIEAESLREIDPELRSLRNMNTPEEYDALRCLWRDGSV